MWRNDSERMKVRRRTPWFPGSLFTMYIRPDGERIGMFIFSLLRSMTGSSILLSGSKRIWSQIVMKYGLMRTNSSVEWTGNIISKKVSKKPCMRGGNLSFLWQNIRWGNLMGFALNEMAYAESNRTPIIAIRVEDFTPPEKFSQYIDYGGICSWWRRSKGVWAKSWRRYYRLLSSESGKKRCKYSDLNIFSV